MSDTKDIMILKSQRIRILEYLQDINATSENLKTNGKTLTDLAESGLNKTQAHKHLPELKLQNFIISQEIATGGRPAENYGITPLGSLLVFKHRLENKSYEEECNELEVIQKEYPLIAKYWNEDLVDFGNLRYKALFNAINRLETRVRGKHYFSISMALQYKDRFITFEKTYALVSTPKEEKIVQGINLEVEDKFREFAEAPQTKRPTLDNITKDLRDFVTFQFYYNLMIAPNSTIKIIKKMAKGTRQNRISKEDYHKQLLDHSRAIREYLGIAIVDPKKLEIELGVISETLLNSMQRILKKDRVLRRLIVEHKDEIRNITNGVLNEI